MVTHHCHRILDKDSLQRRLAAKELECERLVATIEDMERDIQALKDRSHG